MLVYKIHVPPVRQNHMHCTRQPGALPQIHAPLIEWVQPEKESMERVHHGRSELTGVVVCVDKASVSLAAEKHVEQLLDPQTGAQTYEGTPDKKHQVWEIVVVECVRVVQYHPLQRGVLIVVQSQQVTVELTPDGVIVF